MSNLSSERDRLLRVRKLTVNEAEQINFEVLL